MEGLLPFTAIQWSQVKNDGATVWTALPRHCCFEVHIWLFVTLPLLYFLIKQQTTFFLVSRPLFKRSFQVFDSRCRQTKANTIHWDQEALQMRENENSWGKITKGLCLFVCLLFAFVFKVSVTILYIFKYSECSSQGIRVHLRTHLVKIKSASDSHAWQKK